MSITRSAPTTATTLLGELRKDLRRRIREKIGKELRAGSKGVGRLGMVSWRVEEVTSTNPPSQRAVLYLACALFSALWLFMSQTLPVWSEDVLVYPAPATGVLEETFSRKAAPTMAASCADPGPIRIVTTPNLRPQVAVCFRGRQYPLQITSYASGVPYWIAELFRPLHRDRVFRLRVFGLLFGLLGIVLTRRLVRHFADTETANVAALCIAANPGFLFMHATLLHHEVLPWLACAGAIDQLTHCPSLNPSAPARKRPPTGRVVMAAALFGLALLANLKTIFLFGALFLVAFRARVRVLSISRRQFLLAAVAFTIVFSPSIAGNAASGGGQLSDELLFRFRTLIEQLEPARFLAEIPNIAVFWGDALLLPLLASGDDGRPTIPGMVVSLSSVFFCLTAAITFLWRGRGEIVAATCGTIVLVFLAVSTLLYDFQAAGNYMPLPVIFGVGTAVTLVAAARALASRWPGAAVQIQIALVGLAVTTLLGNMLGRGSPATFVTMSINAEAVRNLGHHLQSDPGNPEPIFVTTFVLAGVPETVSDGAAVSIKASDYLNCTPDLNPGDEMDEAALRAGRLCLQRRFKRLLQAFPKSFRVLLPIKSAPIDDALAGELYPALHAAAESVGRGPLQNLDFAGQSTGPLLRLVRVEGSQ